MQMTDDEELMYRRLLDYQWLAEQLPEEIEALARAARFSLAKARRCWGKVAAQFPPSDQGGLRNGRMERERIESGGIRKAQSEGGQRGNDKRWGKGSVEGSDTDDNGIGERSVCNRKTDPEPEPEPEELQQIIIATREAVATHAPGFAQDFDAAFRAATAPESLAQEFVALTQGMHLPSGVIATWAVIGQALRDIATNGERITAKRLRVFVGDLLRPKLQRAVNGSPVTAPVSLVPAKPVRRL